MGARRRRTGKDARAVLKKIFGELGTGGVHNAVKDSTAPLKGLEDDLVAVLNDIVSDDADDPETNSDLPEPEAETL
jgi:hypothetical protein